MSVELHVVASANVCNSCTVVICSFFLLLLSPSVTIVMVAILLCVS